jgi:hypothetical protein
MTCRFTQIALAAALFFPAGAQRAAAAPITVTSGSLLAVNFDVPTSIAPPSTIGGPGFSFTASLVFDQTSGALQPLAACSVPGCAPGDPISFDAFLSTMNAEDGLLDAVLVLNGERVDDFGGGQIANNVLTMHLASERQVPPPFDLSPVTLTAPFDMEGTILLDVNTPGGRRTFGMDGKGTATLRLTPDATHGLWIAQEIRYVFESPAAIPEPSTVLFLGTGLAALARFRARRRV